MNIDLKKKNKELSIITLEISSQDYNDKVESILNDYKKKANVPGFRKGFVPIGMIKKQYELPVKVDEINKLVQSEFAVNSKWMQAGANIDSKTKAGMIKKWI